MYVCFPNFLYIHNNSKKKPSLHSRWLAETPKAVPGAAAAANMNRKSFGSALQDLHGAPTDTEREAKERKRQQYLNELSEQIRQKKERDEAEKMAREKAKGNEVRRNVTK